MKLVNKIIKKIYSKKIIIRYDKDEFVHYFSQSDFEGLKSNPYYLKTTDGEVINGFYYFYDNYDESKLIIFASGLGPGHAAYMREIDTLCKEGFMVLAYDVIGTGVSSGENIKCISNYITCLDLVISSLNCDKELIVIGHSCGGYACSNIYALHKNIKKIVIFSGFLSMKELINQFAKGILKIFANAFYKYEKYINPKYASLDARTSLKDSDANVLWYQSNDDKMVDYNFAFAKAIKELNASNFEFIGLSEKGHNPNYTKDAVKYMYESFSKYNNDIKKGLLKTKEEKKAYMDSLDWLKMTEQDMSVWNKVFDLIRG